MVPDFGSRVILPDLGSYSKAHSFSSFSMLSMFIISLNIFILFLSNLSQPLGLSYLSDDGLYMFVIYMVNYHPKLSPDAHLSVCHRYCARLSFFE